MRLHRPMEMRRNIHPLVLLMTVLFLITQLQTSTSPHPGLLTCPRNIIISTWINTTVHITAWAFRRIQITPASQRWISAATLKTKLLSISQTKQTRVTNQIVCQIPEIDMFKNQHVITKRQGIDQAKRAKHWRHWKVNIWYKWRKKANNNWRGTKTHKTMYKLFQVMVYAIHLSLLTINRSVMAL